MISRRRFLTISCAAAASPLAAAAPARWHGRALGADVSIELSGPAAQTQPALAQARALIAHVERLFSLYDPGSDLVRLNHTGKLDTPHPDFLHLCEAATQLHRLTEGLFDPTVQVLWQALRNGTPPETARPHIGWDRVRLDPGRITLAPGQQLTFNGIAQGFATDLVTDSLTAAGFGDLHVNIGEQAALGAPRRLGIVDPAQGMLGTLTLRNNAVATSSPGATQIGGAPHIFGPAGASPAWSTVSVIAPRAMLADGLSTALCLADWDQARRIHAASGAQRSLFADATGDIRSLT